MKKLQNKILIIFFIIGLIIILGVNGFFIKILNETKKISENSEIITQQKIIEVCNLQTRETRILIFGTILVFSCIVILIGIYISNSIIKPINRIIIDARKMTNSNGVELIEIEKKKRKKKKKNDFESIINIIELMTGEMKSQLNDVKRQKREIEAILLHMNDGIIAFDKQGNIMHINPAAKKFLNIVNENNFEEIFTKIDSNIKMESVMYIDEWKEYKTNINNRNINIFFASYKDENEMSSGIIVVAQDITEHVRLDDMRKEFVADVSHELKTPITSIMGYAETLQDGEYDKETRDRFLGVIISEGRRMANLVNDLLTLSKYDNKNIQEQRTDFDLGLLTKQCLEKLRIQVERKKQKVECFVTADVPPVNADKNGIERVLINILSNAVKYTDEKGEIKIYVGFVYNDAYVKVIDNGIGIPSEDLKRIFERFYRVDKTRSREMGGTGLGLSIAKEIIEENNGSIDIKSEVNKGTEVVIRIPAVKS